MPPKKKVNVILPLELANEIKEWRRHQPDPVPNMSQAARRLIEIGLRADADADKPTKN